MSSCEVVCLSSDEEEKSYMPIIVSTRSVASLNSTVDIISDSEDNVVNGKTEMKKEKNGIESDNCDAGPSASSPPPKKKRVECIPLDQPKAAKTDDGTSPKRKFRKSIQVDENKQLFEQLLTKCEEVDGTQDIKKGTAKARKHFECAQIEFISSKEFKSTIQTSLTKVNRECVWGHLGEVVKQLRLYKEREGDLIGSQKEIDEKKQRLASTNKDAYYQVLKNEQDERIVNKLHKILKKIHKQILKLETQEVDFDDDDESSYIMLERYKARAAKIYEKLSQLTNYPEHADRMSKRKVAFSGTDIPSVNKCIERFVNQNHCFPDYQDVFRLIETVNTAESLGLSPLEVKVMASKAFRDIGGEIKRRRQWDVEDSLYIHLDRGDCDNSAFENDPELLSKLSDNGKKFVENFNKVIEEFTQKQMLEQQSKKETSKSKEKSESSGEANGEDEDSAGEDEDSGKEDGESEEEESSEDEKPVAEEFESDNERDSGAENSSSHEDDEENADNDKTGEPVVGKEEEEESEEDEEKEDEDKNGKEDGAEDEQEDKAENQLEDEVENQLEDEVENQLEDEVKNQLEDEVENQLEDEVENQLEDEVENQLEDEVENQLEDEAEDRKEEEDQGEVEEKDKAEEEVKDKAMEEPKENGKEEDREGEKENGEDDPMDTEKH